MAVWGQRGPTDECSDPDPSNPQWCRDYAGVEGLNVRVQVYYNVVMLDPIYAAIVPNGYVHITGETLMQNEGIEVALGGEAPGGYTGGGGSPGSGPPPTSEPALTVQGGYDWNAGDTIYIQLQFHSPNTTYHIYSDIKAGCSTPCFIDSVTTDSSGLAVLAYTIPIDTPEGSYTLQSRPASDPDTVTASNTINVSTSINPAILTYGDRWPVGSPLLIGLAGHISNTNYAIYWGPDPTPDAQIGSITTDSSGNAAVGSLVHVIGTSPNYTGPGMYLVTSGLATRTIEVLPGCIKVNQGACGQVVTVPAGAIINILLQSHAPVHAYQVEFDGTEIPQSPVTTSAQGEAFLTYTIPETTPNGTYTIRSLDSGSQVASTNIIVETPETPFIYVAGGYTWPAGSSIDYQLRNHLPNTEYDVYWEGTKIVAATQTDVNGTKWLNFTIPITTAQATTYTLASYLTSNGSLTAESPDITVTAEPYLVIVEGNPQLPGSTIHIELYNHTPNTQFDVYVGGVLIPNSPVTTDTSGFASVEYTIPADLEGGEYLVESREGVNQVATTTLELVKADLLVQSIVAPVNPPFNQDIPITVTIVNASPVTITHQSFDVDIYLDPAQTPDLGTSLPPGDVKVWIQPPLGINETTTFTTTIPLYGAFDHHVWARADTSGRIVESDETNNLNDIVISPATCAVEYTFGDVSWSSKAFGNAGRGGSPRISEIGSTFVLTSTGRSTWANHNQSDNDSNRGYYFVYRQQSGDFEVQARLVSQSPTPSQWTKFGLEIRESTAGNAPKVDWAKTRDHGLQARWRTTSSEGRLETNVGTMPAWVRVVRTGNTFQLYSAYTGSSQPTLGDWNLEATYTVAMGDPVLVGLFNASYNAGQDAVSTIDNFRICNANSNCSAGNVIYEPTYDGSLDAGWSEVGFGDVVLESDPTYSVVGDSMTITSDGSSTWASGTESDDDSNRGFFYVYHQVTGNFDVRVRAVSQSNLSGGGTPSQWAKFGLELRASLDGQADKIDWLKTRSNGLQSNWRSGGTISSGSDGNNNLPVWLRIVRNEDQFLLYYAYSTNNPPDDSEWQLHRTISDSSMPQTLFLGLLNASYDAHETTTVELDGYHVCGDPGGAATCGEVREAAGQVVINAVNHTDNIPRSGQEWTITSREGKTGMVVPNAGQNYSSNFTTTAPELQYQVDFTNLGTYYVWILGSAPNNGGDTLYIGLDGVPGSGYNYLDSNESFNTLAWFNSANPSGATPSLNVTSPGPHTINIWTREDGFELYQILLTQDPGYDPRTLSDPLNLKQSQCSAVGSIPLPPGMQQCSQVIQNGRFEEDSQMYLWHYAGIDEQVTRTSVPHYLAPGESFSMLLPAEPVGGIPRHPWLYQEFVMPSWVLTPTQNGGTSANLTLHKGVNHQDAQLDPDPLYVVLRNQSGTITLTTKITVATGSDTPQLNPDLGYDNNDWVQVTDDMIDNMVAAGHNPEDYADQTLQLYFYSPNPNDTYNTRFYLDNVELNICTTQPAPDNYDTLVKGNVRVFLNGVPTPMPGIYVWIYAIDGVMDKTYTIQDSTYSFYDLPADAGGTQYIVYAEYRDADDNLYTASTIIVLNPGQTLTGVDLLLF